VNILRTTTTIEQDSRFQELYLSHEIKTANAQQKMQKNTQDNFGIGNGGIRMGIC